MWVNTRSGNCYAEGTVETGDNVRKCQSVSQSECPELSGLTQTPVTPSHRHTVTPSQSSLRITPRTTLSDRQGKMTLRVRSSSAVTAAARPRCSSVHLPSYPRCCPDTSGLETRDHFDLQPREERQALKRRSRLSTFSFRSRASSVSSFSSASSGCSSPSSPLLCGSDYNTELFWSRYKRGPHCNPVANLLRRSRLRRLITRDKKFSSTLDLCSESMIS